MYKQKDLVKFIDFIRAVDDDFFIGVKRLTDEKATPENVIWKSGLDYKDICQGDILGGLPFFDEVDGQKYEELGMLITNTCDMDLENEKRRAFPASISYALVFDFQKYKDFVKPKFETEQKFQDHIKSIENQRTTNFFYVPKAMGLPGDALVLLNRVNSVRNKSVCRGPENKKYYSLSHFGWWLLLLKIALNYTRMNENLNRSDGTA